MKERYINPMLEILSVACEDILTASLIDAANGSTMSITELFDI